MVYIARNTTNGHFYIGATEKTLAIRRRNHLWNARTGRHGRFWAAIRKYGESAFEFTPLAACKDFFDALEQERKFIAELRPQYNLTAGGGGIKGYRFSAESRAKMAQAKKGKPNHWSGGRMPQEIRDRLAAARRAERGKVLSESQKKSLRVNAAKANVARRKAVLCVTDGREYPSLTAAGKVYGLTTGQLTQYCSGMHQSQRGLVFRYAG